MKESSEAFLDAFTDDANPFLFSQAFASSLEQ
jgi:hypothetical protein